MNKQFVVKMMQAKQMEYQALKEIMPECMVNRIENLENEFVAIAKEYFTSMMKDTNKGTASSTKAPDTKVRKVTIE
ncbi:MAG: hypothetical protein K0R34_3672 [Herbinix sp.]|jgi:hypothetical protein|nr:hypothetical protein [Herbinix sp.]